MPTPQVSSAADELASLVVHRICSRVRYSWFVPAPTTQVCRRAAGEEPAMSRDVLSDLLRSVRLRGAVF